jgi:Ca2+-binding EF-hand superfamily protein
MDEFRQALLGWLNISRLPPQWAERLMDRTDEDGDETIDFSEFLDHHTEICKEGAAAATIQMAYRSSVYNHETKAAVAIQVAYRTSAYNNREEEC